MNAISETRTKPAERSVASEFAIEQFPLIAIVLSFGVAAAYWQHGFLPGGEVAFPLAGVKVPVWHLIWMGFWTGYTMAVVGEAAGIFALPYQMSILQFTGPGVTPTTQLITLLNPFGALFGFRRNRQWNSDFALWVCLGGAVGGLIGPVVRITPLSDVKPFTFAVGLALASAGTHLCYAAYRGFRDRRSSEGLEAKFRMEARNRRAAGLSPAGLPENIGIQTLERQGLYVVIGFWESSGASIGPSCFLRASASASFPRRWAWAADSCWCRYLPQYTGSPCMCSWRLQSLTSSFFPR